MANSIITEIELNLDKLKQSINEAEKEGAKGGKKFGEGFGGGAEMALGGVKGKLLALAAAIAGGFAFGKMIDAAKEQEAAIGHLAASMSAAGGFASDAAIKFNGYASALQDATGISDDLITKNAAMLVSIGNLRGAGLESATKAALNLAAGLRIDVDSAFTMVAKSADGNAAALGRYGIHIKATGDKAKDFALVMDQLNSKFAGAAEAKMKTFEGAVLGMKNSFEDVLKVLGGYITRSPMVIYAITAIGEGFRKFQKYLEETVGGKDILGLVVKKLVQFGQVIVQYVLPPLELLYNMGKDVFMVMATGVQALVVAVATIVLELVKVASLFTDKFDGFKAELQGFVDSSETVLVDMAADTTKTFSETLDFGLTQGAESALAKTQNFVDGFKTTLNQMPKVAAGAGKETVDQMSKDAKAISDIMKNGLLTTISGTTQRLGAALIKGGDAFADFKNFAFNAMGDMSIKMGETMVLQSTAFATLAALISNPFTAAAGSLGFGLALIALGGVLKAAAGGGGGSAAASAGGGVAAAGGSGVDAPGGSNAQISQVAEPQKPGTSVTVQVMGNILDKKETGLYLAEMISDAVGSQGLSMGIA